MHGSNVKCSRYGMRKQTTKIVAEHKTVITGQTTADHLSCCCCCVSTSVLPFHLVFFSQTNLTNLSNTNIVNWQAWRSFSLLTGDSDDRTMMKCIETCAPEIRIVPVNPSLNSRGSAPNSDSVTQIGVKSNSAGTRRLHKWSLLSAYSLSLFSEKDCWTNGREWKKKLLTCVTLYSQWMYSCVVTSAVISIHWFPFSYFSHYSRLLVLFQPVPCHGLPPLSFLFSSDFFLFWMEG